MLRLRCTVPVVLCVIVVASPARADDDLSYTFQFRPQPTPVLQVDLRFNVVAGHPVDLALPNRYGGDGDMWRWITKLRVIDGPVTLTAGSAPEGRTLEASQSGSCHLQYVVDLPSVPLERIVYRRPVIRKDYLHLLGNTFLVRPNWPATRQLRIEFNWRLPQGWKIGNSFGVAKKHQRFEATLGNVLQAVYVAGDFRFEERPLNDGQPLVVALRGAWGFNDHELATTISCIVEMQRNLFDDHRFPFYFVSLLPVDTLPGHVSGVGRYNGFAIFRGAGGGLDHQLIYLLSHELTHTWIPFKTSQAAEAPSTMFWFSEGFTEYYSYVVRLLAGFEEFPMFLDEMNELMNEYWTSPVRNIPNHQAAEEYFTNQKAGRLAYLRGLLIALNWNAAIRSASHGQESLNDLVRTLVKDGAHRNQPIDAAVLAAAARTYGVAEAARHLEEWIEFGQDIEIRPDSLGVCAELSEPKGGPPRFLPKAGPDGSDCVAWFR
jgi:predicted metalloprotease with PDZ domain